MREPTREAVVGCLKHPELLHNSLSCVKGSTRETLYLYKANRPL